MQLMWMKIANTTRQIGLSLNITITKRVICMCICSYLKQYRFPIKLRKNGGAGGYQRVYLVQKNREKSMHIT